MPELTHFPTLPYLYYHTHKVVVIAQRKQKQSGARITQLYHHYSQLNTSTKITIRQCATSSQSSNLANTPTKYDKATKTTYPILLIQVLSLSLPYPYYHTM